MLTVHKLESPTHFERLAVRWQASIARGLALLREGKGDARFICGGLCRESFDLGCIALILGRGDADAARHFAAAAGYAIQWLHSTGTGKGLRVYDLQMEVSEGGMRPVAQHEIRSRPGSEKLSGIDYDHILFITYAFGNAAQMTEVAKFPEEGYQNPNVVSAPYANAFVRVWKHWALGKVEDAQREALSVLTASPEGMANTALSAILTLSTKDREGFAKHLARYLKSHKKQYQQLGNDPKGYVSMGGMALCRLAFDQGISVEDQTYLPVRLLPNYRKVTTPIN